MQASFSGKTRILPEMPRALHLESGIVGKHGLSGHNDRPAAGFDDFILAVFIFGIVYQVIFTAETLRRREKKLTEDERDKGDFLNQFIPFISFTPV